MRKIRTLSVCSVVLLGLAGVPDAARADSLQFTIGAFFPRAEGEFWSTTRDAFSLEKSDFYDGVVGVTYLHGLTPSLEVGFDASFYESEAESAARGFVDEDGFPIFHDTKLTLVPLVLDLRFVPGGRTRVSRGGQGGRHEYSTSRSAFYVGGGVGTSYWRYEELGEFVEFASGTIFYDRFLDSGMTLTGHALAGVDIALGRELGLVIEGRYRWANPEPDSADFRDFGRLDLSGFALSAGISYRF